MGRIRLGRDSARFQKVKDSNRIRISIQEDEDERDNVYGFLSGRTIFVDSGYPDEFSNTKNIMDFIRDNLEIFSDIELRFKDQSIKINSLVLGFLFPALEDNPELEVVILPDQSLDEFLQNLDSFMLQASLKLTSQQPVQLEEKHEVNEDSSPCDSHTTPLRFILPKPPENNPSPVSIQASSQYSTKLSTNLGSEPVAESLHRKLEPGDINPQLNLDPGVKTEISRILQNEECDAKENQAPTLSCRVCNASFDCPKKCFTHEIVDCDIFGSRKAAGKKTASWKNLNSLNSNLTCEICNQIFQSRRAKNIHQRQEHKDIFPSNYYCLYCDKVFANSRCLASHLTLHSEAREFMCDACAMNFRTLKTLQNHQIREHHDELQGVKKYKCSFCDKLFRFPAHLISHERVHTKEKPYKCEKCGKGFSVKCNLMMHMETHKNVDERKFKCTQCSHAATSKILLDLHNNTHLGIRPFVCQSCGASYKRPSHLRRHSLLGCKNLPTNQNFARPRLRTENTSSSITRVLLSHRADAEFVVEQTEEEEQDEKEAGQEKQIKHEVQVLEEDKHSILPDQVSGDQGISIVEEVEEKERIDYEVVEQEVEWMEVVGEEVVIDGQIQYESLNNYN